MQPVLIPEMQNAHSNFIEVVLSTTLERYRQAVQWIQPGAECIRKGRYVWVQSERTGSADVKVETRLAHTFLMHQADSSVEELKRTCAPMSRSAARAV
jgi:hypothetical protein